MISTHNAGFFSCCTVRLSDIVEYIRKTHELPEVDSSAQFAWYKNVNDNDNNNMNTDITFHYFQDYHPIYKYPIDIDFHWKYQFMDYTKIDNKIYPIVRKYFAPSEEIKQIISMMENKYNIDYDNTCVLFYRGNDKNTETKIC